MNSDLIIMERQNIVDIADAIRAKTGSTEQLTLDQMVEEIVGFSGGGEVVLPENARLYYVGTGNTSFIFSNIEFECSADIIIQEE